MNTQSPIVRTLAIVVASLVILFIVVQFAPLAHTPSDPRLSLSTRVAAVTAPPPTARVAAVPVAANTAQPQPQPEAQAKTQQVGGLFIFSADREGYRELYAATRETIGDPAQWKQLTGGYAPARAPALSPDGSKLAFQSRKDGNWEIYVMNLDTGSVTRLTKDLAYDGAPSWSPDGKQLAFESYRSADLDIWRMNADGTSPVNLTSDEPKYDYAPQWAPMGNLILFTSWADGHKQLYTVSSNGVGLRNITDDRFHNEQASWSPDGKRIAFVSNREGCAESVESTLEQPPLQGGVASGNCQRRGVFVGEFDGRDLTNIEQLSYFGYDTAPIWSPDGEWIAFVSTRPKGEPMYVVAADGEGPAQALNEQNVRMGAVVWSDRSMPAAAKQLAAQAPLYVEKPIPADPAEGVKWDFVGLKEVYLAPSYGIVSSAVSESFRALRNRVKSASGVDFLATLSDMTRFISYVCDNTCDTLSWHKSGRAVDTLLTLPSGGREAIVLVREDVNAEVHWRVFLRAAKQDGSQGEPLVAAPWDISVNARANIAPGLGGLEDDILYGYFVDFTDLARDYGWNRISSHDDVDFDWRNNREALEYWHFQKEDGLNWWQAMAEMYPAKQMNQAFDWNKVVDEIGRAPSRTYLKDVPPAPSAWKWYALIPR